MIRNVYKIISEPEPRSREPRAFVFQIEFGRRSLGSGVDALLAEVGLDDFVGLAFPISGNFPGF